MAITDLESSICLGGSTSCFLTWLDDGPALPNGVLDQIGVRRRRLGVVAGSGAISFLPVHWDQTARGLAVPAWIRRQMDQILELGTKELEVDDSGFVLLL
ncbi:hypothetical protein TRIUR3_32179 [Triticum urartu]|uniref:Uncharacterized protein n=1 Tax=Triticum urartu TaxID=4572 RepID=M7ZH90_TRIUA|nr:hypothetical protein TRIUR3_32179 [Triticum urartu]